MYILKDSKIYRHIVKAERGFSIVELLVAFTIFSLIMVTAIGALTSVISANRKARSIQSVMNNLNFALESMARNIRVGTVYHCKTGSPNLPPDGGKGIGQIGAPKDCKNGGELFAFEANDGDPSDTTDQIVYRFANGRIEKCELNCAKGLGGDYISITAPNVVIDDFRFYVQGAKRGDNKQPYVIMTLRGAVGVDPKESSEFQIQTTVSQRIIDF